MAIIRRALTVLYSGEVVDVGASAGLLDATPEILDRALAGSSCPPQTYQESLVAFARAVYGLRLEDGRCVDPSVPTGCGLYDPHRLYREPPVDEITFDGTAQEVRREMMGSYGIDWIEVAFAPAADGRSLTLEFYVSPTAGADLDVQIVQLAGSSEPARPRYHLIPPAMTKIRAQRTRDGHTIYVIPRIRTAAYNRLGLIVTRLDAEDNLSPTGEYSLVLHPSIGRQPQAASDLLWDRPYDPG